jgi:hypothetical protein
MKTTDGMHYVVNGHKVDMMMGFIPQNLQNIF